MIYSTQCLSKERQVLYGIYHLSSTCQPTKNGISICYESSCSLSFLSRKKVLTATVTGEEETNYERWEGFFPYNMSSKHLPEVCKKDYLEKEYFLKTVLNKLRVNVPLLLCLGRREWTMRKQTRQYEDWKQWLQDIFLLSSAQTGAPLLLLVLWNCKGI